MSLNYKHLNQAAVDLLMQAITPWFLGESQKSLIRLADEIVDGAYDILYPYINTLQQNVGIIDQEVSALDLSKVGYEELAEDTGSALVGFLQSGTGAVARTMQEKERETVSVLDFASASERAFVTSRSGAFDATALVQRAVDAAVGKRLFFPSGRYRINAAPNTMPFPWYGGVVVPSSSWLVFDSAATVEVIPNGHSKYMLFSLYNADNVVIEGGQFVGDRTEHTYTNLFSTLADLNSGNYRTKDNYSPDPAVWAEGAVAYVYLDGSNNGTYSHSAGVWTRTTTTVPDYITHEFGAGIHILNSRNVWVRGVSLRDFTGDGIFIGRIGNGPFAHAWTRGVYITDCVIEDCRRQGVSVVIGDNIAITGCVVRNIGRRKNMQDGANPRSGIDIESGSRSKSFNVLVANNVIEGCGGPSIINYDGNNVVISQNSVDSGISYGYGANTTITGNVLNGAGINGNNDWAQVPFTYTRSGTAVTASFAATHALITGDQEYFEFLDANGLVEHSGLFRITAINATTLTFDTPGFAVASGSGRQRYPSKNCAIVGNTIYNGTIYLTGSGIAVQDNAIYNSTGAGVFVHAVAQRVMISGNTIQGAGEVGVFCVAGSQDIFIQGNFIRGVRLTHGAGVQTSALRAVVSDNHITKAACGVKVDAGAAVVRGNFVSLAEYPLARSAGEIFANTGAANTEIVGNTVVGASNIAILSRGCCVIRDNTVQGFSGNNGIVVTGAAAAGSCVMGNKVSSNRATTGNSWAIYAASGANDCRFIGNVINAENAALSHAIHTSTVTGSKITNNVHSGTILNEAGDTLTGNVAY